MMHVSRYFARGAALLLLFSLILGLFACGGNETPDETTRAVPDDSTDGTTATQVDVYTRAAEPLPDALTGLDYGGEKFTILSRVGHECGEDQFTVQELNSEPVNDAIYNRNIAVEDMLNITIQEVGMGYEKMIIEVQKAVMSGDPTYDVVAGSVSYNTPQIDQGFFYNLYDNEIDTYLDLSKPWWPQDWLEEAMMGDRLYCVTGPLCLTFDRFMYVFFYNKDLGEDNGLENMYDVVADGRWTIDYLNTVTKDFYQDLNGNSEIDTEDQFGLLMNTWSHLDIFWSGFDMELLGKDEDGWYVLNADEDKISVAFDKVYALVNENKGTCTDFGESGSSDRTTAFANGQALFCCEHMQIAESEIMRNASIDYGMLPQPKFDEAQKDYHTYSHDQYSVLMIPVSAKDPEMTGAVLQALDYETYTKVEPVYLDQTMKGKYSNDPETRQMLDLIIDGVIEDGCWIYGYNIGQPQVKVFRVPISGKRRTFASEFSKVKHSIPIGLAEWREKIEKLDH